MQEENENKESNLPISQNEKRISESVKKKYRQSNRFC